MKQMKTLTLGKTMYEVVDETSRKDITSLDARIVGLSTKINEQIDPSINGINKSLENKITNPTTGSVGYILAVKSVDENGKPVVYEAIENVKSTYEYAKQGGYKGTEEEFYKKLAQENASKEEFNELKTSLGGYRFYHNPEIICKLVNQTIYLDEDNYVLADSDKGIALLKDTVGYTSVSIIVLVEDNSIYLDEDKYVKSDSDKGVELLENTEVYTSVNVVLENEYVIYTEESEEYGMNNVCYVLANSSLGHELLKNTDYIGMTAHGDFYSSSGIYLTELIGYEAFKVLYSELEKKINNLQTQISLLSKN